MVTTAMVPSSRRKLPSLSSASTTIQSLAPSRAFAALSIKDPAARDAIGSQYLDDEGEPFKYSFDASLEPSSHPLDAEKQLELRGLDKGIEQALEAATRDMKGGATSTGVRAWHAFCRHFGFAPTAR